MATGDKRASKPKSARARVLRDADSNAAPAGSEAPSSDEPSVQGKSIFLFADGTGNSSAKLFKTNVWRLYEAVDLGLASPGKWAQIAYYDNGVGTSSFRPLRLLGGIFGIGLKSNVLRLYTFLCRNYRPNDRIYVFGFSRGAFTIRLLVGLIATQGVIKTKKEAVLAYQVRDAYRAFCGDHWPNRWLARKAAAVLRAVRRTLIVVKRRILGQRAPNDFERYHPDINFVGVWDTVAAYGGPFAEFTRGIDDWIWPLTMPNYELSPKVLKARHALALDEERDAFQPLLWDEFREEELINKGREVLVDSDDGGVLMHRKVVRGRLKQLWFTGVHSDVGGGYPDESLSYISLLWMMDQMSPDASHPEVDFVDSFVQRARDLANPYGPIHDSRSGLGAYYRYQPRKIAAMLNPPNVRYKSLNDPEISRGREPHGLLNTVNVHESVLARVISGIDNYGPTALPAGFIVDPEAGPFSKPTLRPQDRQALTVAAANEALRFERQEAAWNRVWWRRVTYFATVGATSLLLTLPLHRWLDPFETLCSDDRCFAGEIVGTGFFFLPQSIRDFLAPWLAKPLLVISLALAIFALMGIGVRLERHFRDRIRAVWRDYLHGTLQAKPATNMREWRESAVYQNIMSALKWFVLPTFFGLLTLAALIAALAIVVIQTAYAFTEGRETFCANRIDQPGPAVARTIMFDIRHPCTDLKVDVLKDRRYQIDVEVIDQWKDLRLLADPARGVVAPPFHLNLGIPIRRVTKANWLKPVTIVRSHHRDKQLDWLFHPILGSAIDFRILDLKAVGPKSYRGTVCPDRPGHLYLMANDAAPLGSDQFYDNNEGTAHVTVKEIEGPAGDCDKPGQVR